MPCVLAGDEGAWSLLQSTRHRPYLGALCRPEQSLCWEFGYFLPSYMVFRSKYKKSFFSTTDIYVSRLVIRSFIKSRGETTNFFLTKRNELAVNSWLNIFRRFPRSMKEITSINRHPCNISTKPNENDLLINHRD